MDASIVRSSRLKVRPLLWLGGAVCAAVTLMALAALIHGLTSDIGLPRSIRNWMGMSHTTLMIIALTLTVAQVIMPKGTLNHRRLGYAWGATLIVAALISFGMHQINGGISPPHYFSMGTLVVVPLIAYLGATHRRRTHNVVVVAYIFLFLVSAGLFAFDPEERALGMLFADIWR